MNPPGRGCYIRSRGNQTFGMVRMATPIIRISNKRSFLRIPIGLSKPMIGADDALRRRFSRCPPQLPVQGRPNRQTHCATVLEHLQADWSRAAFAHFVMARRVRATCRGNVREHRLPGGGEPRQTAGKPPSSPPVIIPRKPYAASTRSGTSSSRSRGATSCPNRRMFSFAS
jgi:hypothetical protein